MFTLVPSKFFNPASKREALAEVATIAEGAEVKHIDIPEFDAVLIYSVDGDSVVSTPKILELLHRLKECKEYNKILCCIEDDYIYMVVAQGKNLLLANAYKIQDFTTAQYFIFLGIKSHQINPEMSTIYWCGDLNADEEMSLYRYFKAIVKL